ncbi:hypothetical protein C3E97_030695, partial [Pseudomonas sp. MWU12-2115]
WPMLLAIFVGTAAGSLWLGIEGGYWVVRGLGAALLLYALSGLLLPTLRVSPAQERWLAPLCGLVTGVITSATGVFVIPAVPYLQALGLNRDQLVQALGLSFTVSTLALAAGLLWRGALGSAELGASLLTLAPALLGLTLFALLLTKVEATYAGRAYAAYGGIYIIASIAWLGLIERIRPLGSDWLGAALCVLGASIILLGPRFSPS